MAKESTISTRKHPEEGLRLLSNTFLAFTNDPVDNINKLVDLLETMLGAACCMFDDVERGKIYCTCPWLNEHVEHQKNSQLPSLCMDMIQQNPAAPVVMNHLDKGDFYSNNPVLAREGVVSYFAKIVELDRKPVGAICALFREEFVPGIEDEKIISIIASAASVQKSLLEKINLIHEKEAKLQNLIDNSPKVAIQIYTSAGLVKYWNKSSEVLYGISQSEAIGRSLDRLFLDKQSNEDFMKILKDVGATNKIVTSEWDFNGENGREGRIMSTIFSITGPEVPPESKEFVCMDVDLTELKRAEKKLIDYATQLENTNATKDKFFSIIAHDLKNPFNTILGFSRILSEEYNNLNDEEILGFVSTIREASENAFKLLQNLLVWSRLQTGKIEFNPELLNIGLLINETIALLKPQALAKNISLVSSINPSIQVFADENMVKTILRNLVSNGIKYSYPENAVEISATRTDNEVTITIKDTGLGIAAKALPSLFDIDQNSVRAGTSNEQGTGLGLILCREFIHCNKGEITVESVEGKGSSFRFTLPASNIPLKTK
jgi:two-component system, sensor histidine kinase and response regulator